LYEFCLIVARLSPNSSEFPGHWITILIATAVVLVTLLLLS
jgi:hypothetical protein